MKVSAQGKKQSTRKVWIPILIVLVLIASGAGYYYWNSQNSANQQAVDTSTKTTRVRQGSITISASGSGTLTAGQESDLAFATTGTVAEVNVQVGDKVKKGDVLARLSTIDELQDAINSAQQDLVSAQQELATLKQNAPSSLANAQLALSEAKKAVTDAKSGVVQKGWQRCDQKTLDSYYYNYTHAKDYLDSLGDGGGNSDYYLYTILPAKNTVAQALASYEYCAGYTDYEVSSSQATLSLTEAQLVEAQAKVDTLAKNSGIDPIELATAENKVTSAQLALDKAKDNLAGATLIAPFDGTVLTVAGQAGSSSGTGAFITVADLAHPQVEFSIDETDMEKVAVGEQAKVSFDALPNLTFKGKIIRINPSLTTSNGYQVVTGLIQLELDETNSTNPLIKGLNGTVELIQATAENVLIVPVQALRDLGDGTYSVFVVGADGQPKLKVVDVGLQDAASAEIKSGLKVGDVVTTGTQQTK